MTAVPRVRPAPMQAAIVMPPVVTAAMPMRVPMTVATSDLKQVLSSLDMFGGGRDRACRAGCSKNKSRGGGPGNRTYFHGSSFELTAADNGVEPIWFRTVFEVTASGRLANRKTPI